MRIKVELHPDVAWFIRRHCADEERRAFFEQLDNVRASPLDTIEHSEAIIEPELSRYVLRRFEFRGNVAVFEFNAAKDRIRVLECRRIRPQRREQADDGP